MDRKNFLETFNTYFEKNESRFFHFDILVKEYSNELEFNENLHQLFIPFFDSISLKNKYQVLDKINLYKNYDSYYEEDNPDSQFCCFNCKININELYDIITKVESYSKENIEVYRVETNDDRGLYDTFFAALPVDEINHPSPRDDKNFTGIFDHHNNDYNYMQKWNFGFENLVDVKNWLLSEKNISTLKNIGAGIRKITIDKNYVINGNKQIIFQKEEKLSETILELNVLQTIKFNQPILNREISLERYRNMKPYDVQMEVYDACEEGDIKLIKSLLEDKDLNVDINCFNGCFLHKAAKNGHLEIVKYLLTSTTLKENINIHSGNGEALKEACENGHLDIVKYLLTSLELKDHADIYANNNSAFRMACEKQQIEIIEYLLTDSSLKQRFNLEEHGFTPMIIACNKDNVEMAKIFLDTPNLETALDIQKDEDVIFRNALHSKAIKVIHYFIFDKNIKKTEHIESMLAEKPNHIVEKWFTTREFKNRLENKFQEKNIKTKAIKI